jgi:hypothetical protein
VDVERDGGSGGDTLVGADLRGVAGGSFVSAGGSQGAQIVQVAGVGGEGGLRQDELSRGLRCVSLKATAGQEDGESGDGPQSN